MVKQYPHYLFAVQNGGEAHQDEDGNWVQPDNAAPVLIASCREETNGKGTQIQVAGGTFHVFVSLIQLPKDTLLVGVGTSVFVADNADGTSVRVTGGVLKYDVGQLHNRLWI